MGVFKIPLSTMDVFSNVSAVLHCSYELHPRKHMALICSMLFLHNVCKVKTALQLMILQIFLLCWMLLSTWPYYVYDAFMVGMQHVFKISLQTRMQLSGGRDGHFRIVHYSGIIPE